MKQKNTDEHPTGIVGSVWYVSGRRLLLKSHYYLDKCHKKISLNNRFFFVELGKYDFNFFVGDLIRISKSGIENLTEAGSGCQFIDLLSKEEQDLLHKQNKAFLFYGFLEQVNVGEGGAAFRFRVISRLNHEGKRIRVDKLACYCTNCNGLPNLNGQATLFLNNLFSASLRKPITLKFYSAYDPESKKSIDFFAIVGLPNAQTAKGFVNKNC